MFDSQNMKKRIKTNYYCCITINIHKLLIINQQGLMILLSGAGPSVSTKHQTSSRLTWQGSRPVAASAVIIFFYILAEDNFKLTLKQM